MITNQEWIEGIFPGLKSGYFVEAGAHDGVGDSQTKWLEDIGWTGICVEPSSYFHGLQLSRKCKVDNRCLWSGDRCKIEFLEVIDTELSGIRSHFQDHWDREAMDNRSVLKETVSLTTLLVEHGAPPVIQYLALDTEGSELEILQVHDFDRYRFIAMTVEHNNVLAKRQAVQELLATKGYVFDPRATGVDDLFLWEGFR